MRQLNPYGNPTHGRRMKPNLDAPQPSPAGTSVGKRGPGFSSVGIGGSVGGTVRRKVVGASRNPVAPLKSKPVKTQDQGAFTPDEE